jgi:large subunit ribosomal protein L7/L12
MSALTNEEILEAIKVKPALELAELVKLMEETFGVSAAAPVAVAVAGGAGGGEAAAEEEDRRRRARGAGANKIPSSRLFAADGLGQEAKEWSRAPKAVSALPRTRPKGQGQARRAGAAVK